MINDTVLSRFQPLRGGPLLKPIYDDYSFAYIPNTIEFLLTGAERGYRLPADCFGGTYPNPKKIVLIFLDSFGWEFWQKYGDRFRATRQVLDAGTLTPVSALFPSTTAASVTTMNLGVLPAAHALYEWNIYIPAYGEVIQSLAFSPLGRHPQDACKAQGYNPTHLFTANETVYQRLERHGVNSVLFAHRSYSDSAYNTITSKGSRVVRHTTAAEGLVQLKETLASSAGKVLLSFYWAAIDTIAHVYGPGSLQHVAEIASFWRTFDEVFREVKSPDTLYLFTADHGHVYGNANETIYINERIPDSVNWLSSIPNGNPIYPNGSPRDVFLHVQPQRVDEALRVLRQELNDFALVLSMDDALSEGLFGEGPISAEFRRRIGDILILPYIGHFIWWREPGRLKNGFYGHHGGLSSQEIFTVLGAVDEL